MIGEKHCTCFLALTSTISLIGNKETNPRVIFEHFLPKNILSYELLRFTSENKGIKKKRLSTTRMKT